MRVADVTQWYGPTSGGIRTYLHAKTAWAATAGVPHALVLTGPADGRLAVGAGSALVVRGRTPTDRWGYRLAVRARGFLAALDRIRPDVVVVHDATAFPRAVARWAAARGAALVLVCHSHLAGAAGGLPRAVRGPAGAALAVLQRRALTVGDLVVVASETTRRAVDRHARAPVVVSGLGVDLAEFGAAVPDPGLRRRLAPGGGPLVLYAGRLSSEKRVDLLVPMLAALADATLVVAGEGAHRDRLLRAAARAGVADRMRLVGHVADRAALAVLMATADCAVHPNPDEPFGLAPLEALAAGCRVVAPRTGGPAEVVGRRGAVLVDPGSGAALAAGVAAALRRPRPRPDLGDLGWDGVFRREWDLYRMLAGPA